MCCLLVHQTLLWWFAEQAMRAFPPPDDGLVYLIADSTLKGKRGTTHPMAHTTRLSQYHPYVFGFRIVVLLAHWHVYHIPVDFALVRRRGVFTLARSWKFTDGKSLKALVTHLPRWHDQRLRLPTVTGQRRRTFWVCATRGQLRYLGDVTIVLSTCRQNDGPQQTTLLVTNLPETVSARQMVAISLRRWEAELLFRELKGVVGMGQHQVTKDVGRVERSIAVSIMASLLLLRLKAQDIPADRSWSAFALQRALAWEVIDEQCTRSAKRLVRKWLQRLKAA
jgi:hypothetical protein